MKLLFTIVAVWMITLGHNYGQTGPIIGNSPFQVEYKDGRPFLAKGFPPYTEIKEPYAGDIWIVQPDGSMKPEVDIPRIKGSLIYSEGQIIFSDGKTTERYPLSKVPGMKMINFTKKSVTKADHEVDVSELVLELFDRTKLTLKSSQPVQITKISDGDYVRWKIQTK